LRRAKAECEDDGGKIEVIEGPVCGISSTLIREKVANRKSIRYMVPESVIDYIETTQIYWDKEKSFPNKEILKTKLKKELTKSRLKHSINVSECAMELALHYGVDVEKAEIAGLMHDCAKCYYNMKKRKLAKKYGMMDEIYQKKPDLAHAEIGAMVAKEQYGIQDEDVLSAIRKHTTGAEEMSLLDEIIYLADIIEVDRNFKGVEELRRLADVDLHKAVIKAMEQTVEMVKKRGGDVHPQTIRAYKNLKHKYQTSEEIN
jgi:nicotinate-nucleotide adenylyltransferase